MFQSLMSLKSAVFLGLLLAFPITGCQGDSGNGAGVLADGQLGSLNYTVIDPGDLTRSDSEVKGSGSIGFKDPVAGIDSKKHYTLSFGMEDGGSLSLRAQADTKLENGIAINFIRSLATLKASLSIGSKTTDPKTLDGVDASAPITIGVDVHNDENPAHILIWSGNEFSEDAAIFNSEKDGPAPGQGSATFWGLKILRASITSAAIGDPKFTEAE